ncbi:MAG TPA: hypothetical protein VG248_03645 [Caulobacteraceae bacterium]|nr:hypothetical protein [Caulobacteraceae bacterium]
MTASRDGLTERRPLMRWVYVVVAVVGATAIVAAPHFFAPRRHASPPEPAWIVTLTIATALAIAWATAFSVLAFRRLDEFQQAASKFAWYWGSTIGMGVSLPIYVFVLLGGLHWLDPARFHLGADLAVAFRLGYGLAVASAGIGFLAALTFWRLTRR